MSKKNTGGITDQQEKFCQLYTIDPERVSYKAYRGAYPSCKTDKAARAAAARLLTNVSILNRIAELDQPALDKYEITRDRVNKEKARIAFLDPRNLFHPNGIPKAMHELDADTAAAVADLNSEVNTDQEGKLVVVTKVKMQPKVPVLDQLSRQLGQYEKDNLQQTGTMAQLMRMVDGETRGLPPKEEDE